jgi:hypothetical protein
MTLEVDSYCDIEQCLDDGVDVFRYAVAFECVPDVLSLASEPDVWQFGYGDYVRRGFSESRKPQDQRSRMDQWL